jgi:hypothetical protein
VRLLAEIVLIVVAAGVIAGCLARLPAGAATRWHRASHPAPPRPQQLVELESLVSMSASRAVVAHARLRPLLVEIVSRRLAARGGALVRMTDRDGVALLGEPLWEIVRPARPFPEDRSGPGIILPELEAMLVALEQL